MLVGTMLVVENGDLVGQPTGGEHRHNCDHHHNDLTKQRSAQLHEQKFTRRLQRITTSQTRKLMDKLRHCDNCLIKRMLCVSLLN